MIEDSDAQARFPYRTAGGDDVSENETACGVHGQRSWWRDGHCICAELAAAEERGRRAGIEEAAKCAEGFQLFGLGVVKAIRDLAPRDSGKEG